MSACREEDNMNIIIKYLQDVLLEIQGQKVAGYTRSDMTAWLNHCSRNSNPVVLKTAPQGKAHSSVIVLVWVHTLHMGFRVDPM